MRKLHCKLNIPSNSPHTYQIVTGFLLLEMAGKISLTLNYDPSLASRLPINTLIEAIIDNETVVAYDMLDGYNFEVDRVRDYIDKVDYYFKRSFSSDLNQRYQFDSKIYPLGFNYCAKINHPIFKMMSGSRFIDTAKHIAKVILGRKSEFFYSEFEDIPRNNANTMVLFSTRTWEPQSKLTDQENAEREYINEMRVKCIRQLKKELGNSFIGGITSDEYSNQKFPDCILPDHLTNKQNFLNLVKEADICIASMGLHGSNGWKMGEYIAASKAIVSEQQQYTVPGSFLSGKNYEEFKDVDECVRRTIDLASNKERIYQMKVANYEYYQKYLRPDMLVFNSLSTVYN